MKHIVAVILLICLITAAAAAEGIPAADTGVQLAALRAFLTGDPELTPAQAEKALHILQLANTKLDALVGSGDRADVLAAFELLVRIRDSEPELWKLVQDAVLTGDSGQETGTYALNIRTNRFHRPDCTGLKDMNEKNRVDFAGPRDILLATGFKPCQMCRP